MREYVCRVKREVGKSKSAWNREKYGYWCFSSVRISSNGKWEKKDEAEDEKMPKLSESRKATRKWKNKCQKYVRTRSLSLIHSFQRNSFESSLDTWLSAQHTLSAFYRFLVEISTVGFLNMNQHESALTRIKCKWKNKEKKKINEEKLSDSLSLLILVMVLPASSSFHTHFVLCRLFVSCVSRQTYSHSSTFK